MAKTHENAGQAREERVSVQTAAYPREHPVRTAGWAVVVLALVAVAVSALIVGLSSLASIQSQSATSPVVPASREPGAYTEDGAVGPAGATDPFYVLLIGSDSRKGTALYTGRATEHAQVDQHADVITLMRIDPVNYVVTLVSVPRDTVIEPGGPKINDSLLDGDPADVVDAVEELTGIRADAYMMVTFAGFEALIDSLGGVTVDVPQTVTVPDPGTGEDLTVYAGRNRTLDGAQALVLARSRKDYGDDQDAKRQTNVRNIEQAIIERALGEASEEALLDALAALKEDTRTNVDLSLAADTAIAFRENADAVTFYRCTGPYAGYTREDGLWVVDADLQAWAQLMQAVDAGQDPTGIVPEPVMD